MLGELWGRDNGLGVLGLAHAAWMGVVNADDDGDLTLADAIDIAASNLNPGDVMLIEQQTEGANGGCDSSGQTGCVAVEWVEASTTPSFPPRPPASSSSRLQATATRTWMEPNTATADPNAFPTAVPIRAPSSSARARARVLEPGARSPVVLELRQPRQCAGLGRVRGHVGLRSLQGIAHERQRTPTASGTSSASLIVSGAAALLLSIAQQQGVLMTPTQVRSRLVSTGTAQAGSDHIGPLPNLRTALGLFVPTSDAGGPYSTAEGTYRALGRGLVEPAGLGAHLRVGP